MKAVYGSVVSIGDTFVYKVNDVPILAHLANSMRSDDGGFISVDGVFQISDNPMPSSSRGVLGIMKLDDLRGWD